MNQLTSKQQIYNYLQKMSQHFQLDRFSNFTTITISKELSISRSLTSQYLNELVKDDLVVKISSRPVYYLSKNALEQIYHVVLKQNEYISIHELMQELKYSSPDLKDFQKSVGYDGSLSYPISQIKSALLYPDGLPIILYGERGTGKMYLVSCMKEFCQNHLNEKGHIVLDVKKVSLHEERTAQMEDLFGYEHNGEVKKGILENSDGKMLCIQDAQYLSDQAQEKIADFLRYGYFCREGNEYVRVQSKVRLVLCIENEPRISLNENLLINIPVICHIPSLQERSEDERTRLVVHFFQEEQERLKRKILISEKLCNFLVNHQFQGNISDLQKSIKAICANAFSETIHEEEMEVRIYHLPTHLLEQMSVDKYEKEEATFVRIDSFEKHELGEKMIQMWEQLLNAYVDLKNKVNSQARFLEIGQDAVRHYYDVLVFEQSYHDARIDAMNSLVMDVLNIVKNAKNIILPVNCAYVLTRMIISTGRNTSLLNQWESNYSKDIQECLQTMSDMMMNESIIADQIIKQIKTATNVSLSNMNKIFLMLNIRMYNKELQGQDTMGIILSHGYSTASSIADAANSLLNHYIFEAIDMPLDTPVEEITKKLNEYIDNNMHLKNIILLVDMGSLEEIGDVISDTMNVGVINNISTSLALNVGMKMVQHHDLETILSESCEENQCHYKILSVAKKEKAIAITNDVSVSVSEKLSHLLQNSLPKKVDIKFIEYDYDCLQKNKHDDPLFEKYDVVLMVKPLGLKLKGVRSVSLEDIMNFKDIDILNSIFKQYLDEDEIEEFNQNLLKNFSIQSVMENLTILNPQKLLDFVSESVQNLQLVMQKKFQSRTIIGIYIHICFLVERLVTKTAIEIYENLDDFANNHSDFIEQVNQSFDSMLKNYHVKMPISEIAYLYEYIADDEDERKVASDDEF